MVVYLVQQEQHVIIAANCIAFGVKLYIRPCISVPRIFSMWSKLSRVQLHHNPTKIVVPTFSHIEAGATADRSRSSIWLASAAVPAAVASK